MNYLLYIFLGFAMSYSHFDNEKVTIQYILITLLINKV